MCNHERMNESRTWYNAFPMCSLKKVFEIHNFDAVFIYLKLMKTEFSSMMPANAIIIGRLEIARNLKGPPANP